MAKRRKKNGARKRAATVSQAQESKAQANHRRFVEEYIANGRNGKRAYMAVYPRAGERTAAVEASALLTKPNVQELVAERENQLLDELNVTQLRIVREAARLAFVDVRKLYDESGNLKQPHELDDDTAAALASIDTEELFEGRGDDREHVGRLRKVKLFDKGASIERLMKYLGLFKDKDATPPPAPPAHINLSVTIDPGEAYLKMLGGK